MIIELFSVPGGKNSELIRSLNVVQTKLVNKISLLRVKYSHSIHVNTGYPEHLLIQLLEHVKKYNPKVF